MSVDAHNQFPKRLFRSSDISTNFLFSVNTIQLMARVNSTPVFFSSFRFSAPFAMYPWLPKSCFVQYESGPFEPKEPHGRNEVPSQKA